MVQTDLKSIEEKWLKYWEKEKIFKFNFESKKKIYSIDTPPPYISGRMHIGHAFSYAQEDFIARYKRMKGFEVFYPFGTDDNGLPTERWIERMLNIKSKNMARDKFVQIGLKLLKDKTPELIKDWINLGISCDYSMNYSTIDKNTQKLSQQSFLELYKKGEIYFDKFPTIYCPECQTPVAQAELEDREFETQFSTLQFKLKKMNSESLPIATTRPELLGACVAVFVNPNDKRFKSFVGKKAIVPMFEHEVPIIADKSADIEKGTGVLMVCSYGDKYDVDAIQRHRLNPNVVFRSDGSLNVEGYEGLSIKDARKKILDDLKKKGLILKQKQIKHVVNVHDKCGTEIEFLPVEQWFIKLLDKKSELIKQGKKINWYPKYMFKRYENWIKGLQWDWSVSRERHFGIPIPLWYCRDCKEIILANKNELPVDPLEQKKRCIKCGRDAIPENKVLDTWATSSLTPQIARALTGNKIKIPYNLRPQGHDIIRTWAFYTIVKSYLHDGKVPWDDIIISGFVTLGGKKMSKSKGTGVSPRDVMNQYGSDSLRYWAASSKLGDDLDYMEKDIITGKKFITKILNAANFVFMNLKYSKSMPKLVESDRMFLVRLNKLISNSEKAFDNYNYSKVKMDVDSFFWRVFAGNYLEIVKHRVYNGSKEEKASAFYTLYQALLAIVKMMAPFTPYVCEEIYQNYFKSQEGVKSVHLERWPSQIGVKELKHDSKVWKKMVEVVGKVRHAKSEAKKSMKAEIKLSLGKDDAVLLKDVIEDLKSVCGAVEVKEGKFGVEFV